MQSKMGDALSEEFAVSLKIKQGCVSSPGFFSVYCHILRMFIGYRLFADDLALLSPSRKALQTMINLRADFWRKYCLESESCYVGSAMSGWPTG